MVPAIPACGQAPTLMYPYKQNKRTKSDCITWHDKNTASKARTQDTYSAAVLQEHVPYSTGKYNCAKRSILFYIKIRKIVSLAHQHIHRCSTLPRMACTPSKPSESANACSDWKPCRQWLQKPRPQNFKPQTILSCRHGRHLRPSLQVHPMTHPLAFAACRAMRCSQ